MASTSTSSSSTPQQLLTAAAAAGIGFSKPIHTMVMLPSGARELTHAEVEAAAQFFLHGAAAAAASPDGERDQSPTEQGTVLSPDALVLPESLLLQSAPSTTTTTTTTTNATTPAAETMPTPKRARKVSWFRLQASTRAKLLDKYADMLSHVHRWSDESNLRLRAFLRWHHERDHFKKCKDIHYDARHHAISCIRSLRITLSSSDESPQLRIAGLLLCMTP